MSENSSPDSNANAAQSLLETFEVSTFDIVSDGGDGTSVSSETQVADTQLTEKPSVDSQSMDSQPANSIQSEPIADGNAAEEPTEKLANKPPKAKKKPKAVKELPSSESKTASTSTESIPSSGFEELGLNEEVMAAVAKSDYDSPTAIQSQIIPEMLAGRDVLAQSQTGTGKTAAFAMPILSRVDIKKRKPQVLVLAPTRELAIQVAKSFSTYAVCMPDFAVAAIYGGQDYEAQFKQLRRGVHVIVGTPGRVIDHIKRGTLKLDNIDCLVLDEADQMLNMGFIDDVEFVLKQTPDSRQVALFSATLPPPIRDISKKYLNDPAKITIKKKTVTAESIRQRALFVAGHEKMEALTRLLEIEETDGVIVFTKTRESTVVVAQQLCRAGLSAIALNGDMPQKTRERTIEQLKSGQLNILVATDVAARGLDVTRVSHVFNYDLPNDSESYIHRVGRTGRAGRPGEAIIFLTNAQRRKLRVIESATKQAIEVVPIPSAKDINAIRVEKFKQRIASTIATGDLEVFETMVAELAESSGVPVTKIAAALAQIGQRGQSFFVKDKQKYQRPERTERGRPDRGAPRGRRSATPEHGMSRFRIEVGRRDGVKPGNIVGAIANEVGIDGRSIGPITINDAFSTVDLPLGMPNDIMRTLKETRVVGKQLRLRPATEADAAEPRPKGKPFAYGKPYKGKSKDGKPFGKDKSGKPFAKGKFKAGKRKKKQSPANR